MDMLLSLLKSAAPTLATAVAGPAGGAAVAFIANKLGIDDKTVEGVTKALTGNPELQMKLAEIDLEYAKMDQKDRDGARTYAVEMAKQDVWPLTKNITTVLSLGVIALSFALFAVLMTIEVKSIAKDILIYILGVLSAAITQILSFYFGSSQGSKNKQQEIDRLMGGK